jgi:hypothetical protein
MRYNFCKLLDPEGGGACKILRKWPVKYLPSTPVRLQYDGTLSYFSHEQGVFPSPSESLIELGSLRQCGLCLLVCSARHPVS